jgi:hypothetical protein
MIDLMDLDRLFLTMDGNLIEEIGEEASSGEKGKSSIQLECALTRELLELGRERGLESPTILTEPSAIAANGIETLQMETAAFTTYKAAWSIREALKMA